MDKQEFQFVCHEGNKAGWCKSEWPGGGLLKQVVRKAS